MPFPCSPKNPIKFILHCYSLDVFRHLCGPHTLRSEVVPANNVTQHVGISRFLIVYEVFYNLSTDFSSIDVVYDSANLRGKYNDKATKC